MKYKVGQKVRVKQWLNMPQDLQASYSMNVCRIGEIGIIMNLLGEEVGMECYDVIFEGNEYPMFFFREELEPLVRVGEQLLFDFIKE